jgi:2-iminobutanoate/2-iminopropanoate deaminase
MKKQIITTKRPPRFHYSQGVKTGQFIFTAQVGNEDPESRKEIIGIEDQTRQTLENIKAILQSAGSSLSDVISTTVYLPNMEDFLQMNEVWKEYFPNDPPTRATVSAGLVSQKMLVEVQAIAVCP